MVMIGSQTFCNNANTSGKDIHLFEEVKNWNAVPSDELLSSDKCMFIHHHLDTRVSVSLKLDDGEAHHMHNMKQT